MEGKIPVLVTTKHRGVFFGYAAEADLTATDIWLHACRNAIRWATTKGFLELASDGPNMNSKVGAEAEKVFVRDVTCVSVCTDKAAAAWKACA